MREETKEFACMAEAVAHYFDEGFYTMATGSDRKVMGRNEGQEWVVLRQIGFLRVSAVAQLKETEA